MAAGKTTNKSKAASTKKTGSAKTTNKNKKTTQTKKTTANKAVSTKIEKEKYIPTEKDIKIRNEILLLIALLVTFLLELSNFGVLSPVGDYLAYFMFGIFGFVAYVLPIAIFVGIAFLVSNKYSRKSIIKFSASTMLYILIASGIQLIFMDYKSDISVLEYYHICGKGKSGGGVIGAFIEKNLQSTVGLIGTYVILAILIIISIILITEKSFISGIKKGSAVVYESAKVDAQRIKKNAKERAKERAYQKKEKRMDNQVRGVSLVKVGDNLTEEVDVHEIHETIREIPMDDAEVYRGHVDISNNDFREEYNTSVTDGFDDMEEISSANYEEYNSFSQEEMHVDKNMNVSTSLEENHYDEDGMFVPKEKIEVSESAKNVMNRKAFGVASERRSSISSSTSSTVENNKPQIKKNKEYVLPSTELLNKGKGSTLGNGNISELKQTADKLKVILQTFGVKANVVDYSRGPSVTRYEIQPETGTRLSKITSLADDIKLNLAATDIRIEPVPGKSTIGIEVPNAGRDSVLIRDLIESKELRGNSSKIAFAAGMDIAGNVVVGDIAKLPHMLVAGTTGSGKSVFTNSIIMSILFRAKPTEVRLIIVDPKVVEFGVYNGIPHLLQPVVTDPKLASSTLKWAVAEMSDRYKKFADLNVRDLKGYNEKIATLKDSGLKKLPQIVIVIDELADLMMVAAKEVEESICRLAQLARAAGIHLIIATQRPSVDVVTGLIKANVPSRCALMVSSGIDSRTIIDTNGAEKLLGNGDMLFNPSGYLKPVRLQGAFVSDAEVQRVVEFWKAQAGDDVYDESVGNYLANPVSVTNGEDEDRDDYFFEAARFVIEKEKASTSMLQRVFKIGFNRAARIMDQLCEAGVVGEEEGTKPRRVLMTIEELEQLK